MDVMIDLETLGTSPGCVVLSVGVVCFDPHGEDIPLPGSEGSVGLDAYLDVAQQKRHGLHVNPDTLSWWKKKNSVLLEKLMSHPDATHPRVALDRVSKLIRRKDGRVWCRGASFDFPILQHLFNEYAIATPWEYWDQMDCRTLAYLATGSQTSRCEIALPEGFVEHDSLWDCWRQAREVQELIRKIAIKE